MTDTVNRAKRLVARVVLLQAAGAVVVALIFWMASGSRAAMSALAGGAIVAIGSAVFGWRMFAPGIAGAAVLKRAMMAGEMLKWCWLVLAVWGALAKLQLPPMPLLVGLIVAQFGYWFGLVGRIK
jgi:F0F1-type ATP synthase assembly protein I